VPPVIQLKKTKLLPSPYKSTQTNANKSHALPSVVKLAKQALGNVEQHPI
jgi:hypothetical protein